MFEPFRLSSEVSAVFTEAISDIVPTLRKGIIQSFIHTTSFVLAH